MQTGFYFLPVVGQKESGIMAEQGSLKTPAAAWTLHGEKDVKAARRSFDMYIFEMS